MGGDGNGRLHFGDFELDAPSGQLFLQGTPVKIQPQPLRVLQALVERHGQTVSRDELRSHIWKGATFVEFDQGLNYCIRQIRRALNDDAANPIYIETLPKQGYRFIADVTGHRNGAAVVTETAATPVKAPWPGQLVVAGICACLAVCAAGLYLYRSLRARPAGIQYTQLTDFADSALAPALSPDGRMVAFIRGGSGFLTADQIYVKMLPNGEARRLTDDPRPKYGPAFSPDGSQVAYTVLVPGFFDTYIVSALGGESHLFVKNSAGLTWLEPNLLLFSQVRSGIHMGVVKATAMRENLREVYFPAHERGMAHYSYASPDHRSALVVEMDAEGKWAPCRLVSLDGGFENRQAGPRGACTSAAWSPNGEWMYFTASVEGQRHLWRQRFPKGPLEQITFGPTDEDGIAVERNGRWVITSMGMQDSTIWLHDPQGDRSLSSEGEVVGSPPPSFSADGKILYYLLRHSPGEATPQLWRTFIETGRSECVFPDVSMSAYDVSPDGREVVYSAAGPNGGSQLWLAPIDRSSPARHIGSSGESSPYFGPHGEILFQLAEGRSNYLERMNRDGSGRAKVVPYAIDGIEGISPGRHWVTAVVPHFDENGVAAVVIPTDGGRWRRMCASYCRPTWSPNGKFLFIPVEWPTRTSAGRSLAIPVGDGENLPELPAGGILPLANESAAPGSQSVGRAVLVPGLDPFHFAYVKTSVHRNLYRISMP